MIPVAAYRQAPLALALSLGALQPLGAQQLLDAPSIAGSRTTSVTARHGMVVAQEARAARIGVEILQRAATRSMPRSRSASRWR